jgi:hypothetical protein
VQEDNDYSSKIYVEFLEKKLDETNKKLQELSINIVQCNILMAKNETKNERITESLKEVNLIEKELNRLNLDILKLHSIQQVIVNDVKEIKEEAVQKENQKRESKNFFKSESLKIGLNTFGVLLGFIILNAAIHFDEILIMFKPK